MARIASIHQGSLADRVLSICVPRYPNIHASRDQIILNDVAIAAQLSRQGNLLLRSLTTFPERHSSVYDHGRIYGGNDCFLSGQVPCSPNFSGEELKKRTNNYHPDYNFCCSNFGIWYKGHAENGNEFKIAAELSSHENVLKLIGYCL